MKLAAVEIVRCHFDSQTAKFGLTLKHVLNDGSMATANPQSPPAAPEIQPRIRIRAAQAVGMILLAILPVLALLDVFGDSVAEARASGSQLELRVNYPARFRYKTIHPIEVQVINRFDRPLDRVIVKFDENYLSQFSNVQLTPAADKAYEVELRDVQPGEERVISVEIQAERYWRHRGTVTATAGPDSVTARLETFTFP